MMIKTTWNVALLLFFTALAAASSTTVGGQDRDFIMLAGVRLQLGMSEMHARRQLEHYNTITEGGLVISKGSPSEYRGSVTFKNGRLDWAEKNWTEGLDQRASVEVIRRLIGVVGTQSACVAGTATEEEPSLRSSRLVFRCASSRQIEVSVFETPGKGIPYVTVREVYGPRRQN